MTKKLEYVIPILQGLLSGVAGLMIFVLFFARLGATLEWIRTNAVFGTVIIGLFIVAVTEWKFDK